MFHIRENCKRKTRDREKNRIERFVDPCSAYSMWSMLSERLAILICLGRLCICLCCVCVTRKIGVLILYSHFDFSIHLSIPFIRSTTYHFQTFSDFVISSCFLWCHSNNANIANPKLISFLGGLVGCSNNISLSMSMGCRCR